MHCFHVHRWKYVIDEANVILSKRATVHSAIQCEKWFAFGYPTAQTRFQNYSAV